MLAYVVRRLGQSLLVMAAALIFVFLVGHIIGDPVDMMLPLEAPPAMRQALRAELGFDQPLWVQLQAFLRRVFSGFGESIWQQQPSLGIALERLVPTLYLTVGAMLVAAPTGVLFGALAAASPGSALDRGITLFSLGGISTVDFWLGLMLILLFALYLGMLPTSGYGGPAYLVLPALTLAWRSIGRLTQITRSAMLDEYAKPYVQVARAKGMPEHRVFMHAFKNASIPILTLAGDEAANMANGTVAVEMVFAWPGIGRLFIQAIERRDLFLIEAIVFVIAAMTMLINLVIDLIYAFLDPKIQYS